MKLNKTQLVIGILLLGFCAVNVWAASASQDIGGIASNIFGTFQNIENLITKVAYVAGMGFAMAAILKFKAHKDNPTQIPIGTPIALLFVAAALLFLPSIFGIAGQTVFGTTAQSGQNGNTTTGS